MKDFVFRGENISYNYYWLDSYSFIFEFGEGKLADAEGDAFFFHCEYHSDNGEYIFQMWWEDDNMPANEDYISNSEREYVKRFMCHLMAQTKRK